MPETRSALASMYRPDRFGADDKVPGLSIAERRLSAVYQIAGWTGTFESAIAPLLETLWAGGTPGYRTAVHCKNRTVLFRIAPERLLLQSPRHKVWQSIAGAVAGTDLQTLDLSHARTCLRLSGPSVRDLLACLLPIDLDEELFQPDDFVQSCVHHLPVLLHRLNQRGAAVFELHVARTYAVSMFEWIGDHAVRFGYEVSAPIDD